MALAIVGLTSTQPPITFMFEGTFIMVNKYRTNKSLSLEDFVPPESDPTPVPAAAPAPAAPIAPAPEPVPAPAQDEPPAAPAAPAEPPATPAAPAPAPDEQPAGGEQPQEPPAADPQPAPQPAPATAEASDQDHVAESNQAQLEFNDLVSQNTAEIRDIAVGTAAADEIQKRADDVKENADGPADLTDEQLQKVTATVEAWARIIDMPNYLIRTASTESVAFNSRRDYLRYSAENIAQTATTARNAVEAAVNVTKDFLNRLLAKLQELWQSYTKRAAALKAKAEAAAAVAPQELAAMPLLATATGAPLTAAQLPTVLQHHNEQIKRLTEVFLGASKEFLKASQELLRQGNVEQANAHLQSVAQTLLSHDMQSTPPASPDYKRFNVPAGGAIYHTPLHFAGRTLFVILQAKPGPGDRATIEADASFKPLAKETKVQGATKEQAVAIAAAVVANATARGELNSLFKTALQDILSIESLVISSTGKADQAVVADMKNILGAIRGLVTSSVGSLLKYDSSVNAAALTFAERSLDAKKAETPAGQQQQQQLGTPAPAAA